LRASGSKGLDPQLLIKSKRKLGRHNKHKHHHHSKVKGDIAGLRLFASALKTTTTVLTSKSKRSKHRHHHLHHHKASVSSSSLSSFSSISSSTSSSPPSKTSSRDVASDLTALNGLLKSQNSELSQQDEQIAQQQEEIAKLRAALQEARSQQQPHNLVAVHDHQQKQLLSSLASRVASLEKTTSRAASLEKLGQCQLDLDIVFVLGGTSENWPKIISWVASYVDIWHIAPNMFDGYQVSVVTYGSNAKTEIYFSDFETDKTGLEAKIKALPAPQGTPSYSAAMTAAKTAQNGDGVRQVDNVVVFVADSGPHDESYFTAADDLKSTQGLASVYSVVIGSGANLTDLGKYVCSDASNYFFEVKNADSLNQVDLNINSEICGGTFSPTAAPTVVATLNPTRKPTTNSPPAQPTNKPSRSPSALPTNKPSNSPTKIPSRLPTKLPTVSPTFKPTTQAPTSSPTASPTAAPTHSPTTAKPSLSPTFAPTLSPTVAPSRSPTANPTTGNPTHFPTFAPTHSPTLAPTPVPSANPTTSKPTASPSVSPTAAPSVSPTAAPTFAPTVAPTAAPTLAPTTSQPTRSPTAGPTESPTVVPTASPSRAPSPPPTTKAPTSKSPTFQPTYLPSYQPTVQPTRRPSKSPTGHPSRSPTRVPSSRSPTLKPTQQPTSEPTKEPTHVPTTLPTRVPTSNPTAPSINHRNYIVHMVRNDMPAPDIQIYTLPPSPVPTSHVVGMAPYGPPPAPGTFVNGQWQTQQQYEKPPATDIYGRILTQDDYDRMNAAAGFGVPVNAGLSATVRGQNFPFPTRFNPNDFPRTGAASQTVNANLNKIVSDNAFYNYANYPNSGAQGGTNGDCSCCSKNGDSNNIGPNNPYNALSSNYLGLLQRGQHKRTKRKSTSSAQQPGVLSPFPPSSSCPCCVPHNPALTDTPQKALINGGGAGEFSPGYNTGNLFGDFHKLHDGLDGPGSPGWNPDWNQYVYPRKPDPDWPIIKDLGAIPNLPGPPGTEGFLNTATGQFYTARWDPPPPRYEPPVPVLPSYESGITPEQVHQKLHSELRPAIPDQGQYAGNLLPPDLGSGLRLPER